MPGCGRAPEGDTVPVPGTGAQVQQSQTSDQGVSAEVRQSNYPSECKESKDSSDTITCCIH